MKNHYTILLSATLLTCLLFVGCKKDETDPNFVQFQEIDPSSFLLNRYNADLSDIRLSELRFSLRDAALSFETVEDYQRVKHAMLHASSEEIDAWATSIGFNSRARQKRAIQARLSANPQSDPSSLLSESELLSFYLDDEGWLYSRGFSLLMDELCNEQGVFYLANDLNYFSEDYHILLDEGNFSRLNEVLDNPEAVANQQLDEVFVTPFSRRHLADTTVFSPCGQAFNQSFLEGVGPESAIIVSKKETVEEEHYRMQFSLRATSLFLSVSPDQSVIEFSMLSELENRKKNALIWDTLSPLSEMGTLRTLNSQGAASGEVSQQTDDVWKSVRLGRSIFFFKRDPFVVAFPPETGFEGLATATNIGGGLDRKVKRAGNNSQLIDEWLVSITITEADTEWRLNTSYSMRRGQLSANWLDISETMDIQIGCPD